jgi:transcription initiation factor TFIIE subunit alpha
MQLSKVRLLNMQAFFLLFIVLQTVKGAKLYNAAIAAVSEDHPGGREGEEKLKVHTHSYCCIDYAQVYDIVRYRIHRAKKKIKDQLEDRNTIQEYICPNSGCGRRYSALDALRLVNPFDENFHCENCNAELVAESDKLAAVELGDGDGEDNARRRRHEKLKELLEKMDVSTSYSSPVYMHYVLVHHQQMSRNICWLSCSLQTQSMMWP